MATDPFTRDTIQPNQQTVRCPRGHVHLPDSWVAAGNRCCYPGCDYVGSPIGSIPAQESGQSVPAGSLTRRMWAVLSVVGIIVVAFVFLRNPNNSTPRPPVQPITVAITPSPNSQAIAHDQATITAKATRTSSAQKTRSAQLTAVARSTVRAAANSTATTIGAQTIAARQTATAQSQPATGQVTSNIGLRVRPGPGTEYEPPIRTLPQGTTVSIVGWNTASDGTLWWKITQPSGWVSSEFVRAQGCTDCVAKVDRPPRPTVTSVPSTAIPAIPVSIATNRGPLLNQEQNGWSYQYEEGRGSGNFNLLYDRHPYNNIDCYISPLDANARVCANGELHPSPKGRVAYRWDSNYDGSARITVAAHKVDTSCGDGIKVQVTMGERGGPPFQLDEFTIAGSNNNERTRPYDLQLSSSTYILVMIDMNRESGCDQSRVNIDINRN